jgi:MoxR-like ATPase
MLASEARDAALVGAAVGAAALLMIFALLGQPVAAPAHVAAAIWSRLGATLVAGAAGAALGALVRWRWRGTYDRGDFLYPLVRIATITVGIVLLVFACGVSTSTSRIFAFGPAVAVLTLSMLLVQRLGIRWAKGIALAICMAAVFAVLGFFVPALPFAVLVSVATAVLYLTAAMADTDTKDGWLKKWPIRWELPDSHLTVAPEYVMTGPDLIEDVVRSIELNQSVILAGPRGCGKSHCIRVAIQDAADRGILQRDRNHALDRRDRRVASVFLQGNRETPRDYLVEDEIIFEKDTGGASGSVEIRPDTRSAPLFRFAVRDPSSGRPRTNGVRVDELFLDPDNPQASEKVDKFVLFLDEVNRFSDGVLDSLLTVLEEQTAVMAGTEYRLPVVVCMTMNPPGYDATARALSPPLAARIGRSYRLNSPDLDTLTDLIVNDRIENRRKAHEALFPRLPDSFVGQNTKMLTLAEVHKLEPDWFPDAPLLWEAKDRITIDALRTAHLDRFPDVHILLRRKAALVTLCLWGNVSGSNGEGGPLRPGNEYLTEQTRAMLREIRDEDAVMREQMDRITELCRFGPDGRAAADWLIAAIGLAMTEATQNRWRTTMLTEEHLRRTVKVSVAHKIYDSFAQGSRPDKTAAKEDAVEAIALQVLFSPDQVYAKYLKRTVDHDSEMAAFTKNVFEGREQAIKAIVPAVQKAFCDSQLTANKQVAQWCKAAAEFAKLDVKERKLEVLEANLIQQGILIKAPAPHSAEGAKTNGQPSKDGFSGRQHDKFARRLSTLEPEHQSLDCFHRFLKELLAHDKVGAVRRNIGEFVAQFEVVRMLRPGSLADLIRAHRPNPSNELVVGIATILQLIWQEDFDDDEEPIRSPEDPVHMRDEMKLSVDSALNEVNAYGTDAPVVASVIRALVDDRQSGSLRERAYFKKGVRYSEYLDALEGELMKLQAPPVRANGAQQPPAV